MQIKNLAAAVAILGEQLTALAERRDALVAQSAAIEKELGELNPQITKLEAVFRSPPDPSAVVPAPAA